MNWVRELLNLYESNLGIVGEEITGRFGEDVILLPPYHTTQKATVTVVLSPSGDFLRANRVAKDDAVTVIPATEESASRTSGSAAHPLCDKLSYLAADYNVYARTVDVDKSAEEKHRMYLDGLKSWADSEYSHEKVQAVYNYILKEHIIDDLLRSGVLETDENGKIQDIKQEFVRFSVEAEWSDDLTPAECWLDITLRESYIRYVKSRAGNKGISYLTGEVVPISYLQPKKIRNDGDGAKLISSNDSDGFTYRGRFSTAEEAFAIGYEESQKIHNALKWIIRKQGSNFGGLCVVVWESQMNPLPDYSSSTNEICSVKEAFTEEEENRDTDPTSAARFESAMNGYIKATDFSSKTVIMALNAATPGRLSVIEASELSTSEYLENIKKWHTDCGLIHYSYAKGSPLYYGVPGLKEIAGILYGREKISGDEKLLQSFCNRLRPCIIYSRRLPQDIVNLAINRASSPVSFDIKSRDWERTLSLACSFIKKKEKENGSKEDWNVSLNTNSTDRSYLFGRLLAVADRIEYLTYQKDEDRLTNAKRYMNLFSRQPMKTWANIHDRIIPYLQKLSVGQRIYYERLIGEITEKMNEADFADNSPLNGLYLLGFYNQSYAFRNKKEQEENENE